MSIFKNIDIGNRCNEPGGWTGSQVIFFLNHNDLNYRRQLNLMISNVRNNKPNAQWDLKWDESRVKALVGFVHWILMKIKTKSWRVNKKNNEKIPKNKE